MTIVTVQVKRDRKGKPLVIPPTPFLSPTWRFMGRRKQGLGLQIVVSVVTLFITLFKAHITLLISTHEPPSRYTV